MSSAWNGITTDIYNPIKGTFIDLNGAYSVKNVETDINQIAVYLEDQFNLTDNLTFVLGLRHDTIDVDWHYFTNDTKKERTYNEFSYR